MHHTKRHWPGLFPGLLLVSLGGGLLARELGYLPPTLRFVDFWPLLLVFVGIAALLHAEGVVRRLFGLSFIGFGGVLLAGNLGFLSFSVGRFWPLLLIFLGLAFLLRGRGRRSGPPSGPDAGRPWDRPNWGRETSDADRLSKQITFSGAQYKIDSQAWKGGELGVTAGGVELDLRAARLAPEGAVLDVRVVMGGLEIRVPDTWQVLCEVTPLLAGADDMTRTTQGVENSPRLRITGTVTLGGVNIQN